MTLRGPPRSCPHCGARHYHPTKGWPGSYHCHVCDKIFNILDERLQIWALEYARDRGLRHPFIVAEQATLFKTVAYWIADPFGHALGVVVNFHWEVVIEFEAETIPPGALPIEDTIPFWKDRKDS